MKKYFIALLFAACFILPLSANETIDEAEEYIEDEENFNVFGYPDKSFIKVIENKAKPSFIQTREKPECSDKTLIEAARKTAEPFINVPSISIFNKRRNEVGYFLFT